MSWSTCYSGSNNIHTGFPPLMSDGRILNNFDPNCKANTILKNNVGLKSNYDYRQYLINNGLHIINENSKNAQYTCGYHNMINAKTNSIENNKYIYKTTGDNTMPYGYEGSDLKNLYLSRHQLQNKLNAPIMTQEELLIRRSSN